uniref:Secreted protein n=1 Tax=Chromera velia CCMP2878 TaxID=1169474 RepID=A0A0G4I711_9ALVE|eukprot:Cvel_11475.t1-p1 / transcript=Cvel_11475.t1 / gene=Cvel_11475 / organism=Chromera_velia_CCMP2878 / gene_product=hypothetical protein / transcript_product=hypothetical protein / location=Cvel_scaffold722:52767-53201(-) / protein_length=81 / sequence_SO=supercontig / SO=protein_coding / is_pseudo=false
MRTLCSSILLALGAGVCSHAEGSPFPLSSNTRLSTGDGDGDGTFSSSPEGVFKGHVRSHGMSPCCTAPSCTLSSRQSLAKS